MFHWGYATLCFWASEGPNEAPRNSPNGVKVSRGWARLYSLRNLWPPNSSLLFCFSLRQSWKVYVWHIISFSEHVLDGFECNKICLGGCFFSTFHILSAASLWTVCTHWILFYEYYGLSSAKKKLYLLTLTLVQFWWGTLYCLSPPCCVTCLWGYVTILLTLLLNWNMSPSIEPFHRAMPRRRSIRGCSLTKE